jgi:hypothetical protein
MKQRRDRFEVSAVYPPMPRRPRPINLEALLQSAAWTIGGGALVWLLLKAGGAS